MYNAELVQFIVPTAKTPQDIATASNILELIDHDISRKMDLAISLDDTLNTFVPSPYDTPDLASRVNYSLLETPYGEGSEPPTRETILHSSTIYHFPFDSLLSLKDPTHRRYFDVFFSEFSEILMPVKSGPNVIRDILLQYSMRKDYLYFAVLASGARLSYRKTMLEDDQSYCAAFMKKTLEMLNDFTLIQNYCRNPDGNGNAEIVPQTLEPLLLTILLLTSDNASSMKDSWRGHLKGAKELMHKIFIDDIFPKTRVLVFCKCWFTLFEVLAGLTAPYGGTLAQDVETKKLSTDVNDPYEMQVLMDLHIVRKDGFNNIFGFHSALLPPLIKLIEKIRDAMTRLSDEIVTDSDFVFGLIAELNQCKFYNVRDVPPEVEFCWTQAMHLVYIYAALLTVLTKFLQVPSINVVVQELVNSILDSVSRGLDDAQMEALIQPSTSHQPTKNVVFNVMMVQWPLLAAGLNASNQGQRYKAETMFRLLAEWGSGSAKFSLGKLKRAWNNEQPSLLEVDIVTY